MFDIASHVQNHEYISKSRSTYVDDVHQFSNTDRLKQFSSKN